MSRLAFLASILALSACGGGGDRTRRLPPSVASAWQIGPVIDGRNYSTGLPLNPRPESGAIWRFDWTAGSSAHYVTAPLGSLTGKRSIRMRFRLDLAPGASIYGTKCATSATAGIVIFFQRQGDDWHRDGYRYWHKSGLVVLDHAGEYTLTASLAGPGWGNLAGSYETGPAMFEEAKEKADRVGFTFANCEGYGHGASSTGAASFTLLEFTVQ